jgi:curved DNA-binding protein CbpA
MDKDYYRTLGVLDDAEDIVIKAAYRALAQKYHPDRWQGNAAEATRRMAEINAAYAVLSDPDKRRAYDATRDKSDFQDDSADADDSQDAFAAIDKDWAIATKYKPELIAIEAGLRRIARELGTTYKLILLEHKNFDDYQNVGQMLEQVYFKKYFGSTKLAQDFAKELILAGRRDAAKELNQTVRVLGTCDEQIINRIAAQFKVRGGHAGRLATLQDVIRAYRLWWGSDPPGDPQTLMDKLNSYAARYQSPIRCRFQITRGWLGRQKKELTFFRLEARGKESVILPWELDVMLWKDFKGVN